MEVTAESPTLGAAEDVKSMTYLLRHLAAGGGVAPHWLAEPEDANRSTAAQMDMPVLRGLVDTQAWWARNIGDMAAYAIDQKVRAGQLPAVLPVVKGRTVVPDSGQPAKDHIEVVTPEIDEGRVERSAQTLAAVAEAFTPLETLGAVGVDTITKVVHRLLPALGIPADELPDPDDPEAAVSRLRAFASKDALEEAFADATAR